MFIKFLVTVAVILGSLNAFAAQDGIDEASGNCVSQIRKAVKEFEGIRISKSAWDDGALAFDSYSNRPNIIEVSYNDKDSCVHYFDATIQPLTTAPVPNSSEPNTTLNAATSCKVLNVEEGSNPVDCG